MCEASDLIVVSPPQRSVAAFLISGSVFVIAFGVVVVVLVVATAEVAVPTTSLTAAEREVAASASTHGHVTAPSASHAWESTAVESSASTVVAASLDKLRRLLVERRSVEVARPVFAVTLVSASSFLVEIAGSGVAVSVLFRSLSVGISAAHHAASGSASTQNRSVVASVFPLVISLRPAFVFGEIPGSVVLSISVKFLSAVIIHVALSEGLVPGRLGASPECAAFASSPPTASAAVFCEISAFKDLELFDLFLSLVPVSSPLGISAEAASFLPLILTLAIWLVGVSEVSASAPTASSTVFVGHTSAAPHASAHASHAAHATEPTSSLFVESPARRLVVLPAHSLFAFLFTRIGLFKILDRPALTTAEVTSFAATEVAAFSTTEVFSVFASEVTSVSPAEVASFSPAEVASFSPAEVASVSTTEVASVSSAAAATARSLSLSVALGNGRGCFSSWLLNLFGDVRVVNPGTSGASASSLTTTAPASGCVGVSVDLALGLLLPLLRLLWSLLFSALLRVLDTLFLGLGLLVADLALVKRLLGEDAVESSDSAVLFDLLEALDLGLVDVDDDCAVNFVELVQVSDSALNQLDEDKSLDDGVSSGPDGELRVTRLGVEDAERVAEVAADLAGDRDSDFVLGGLFLLLLYLLISLHI